MTKINIGIDASRGRSGGARAHLIGIVNEVITNKPIGLGELHIWSYPELLEKLPKCDWIIKHIFQDYQKSLPIQMYWQYAKLPKEAKANNIDIMLNIDAGTVCPFQPSVTMSRDMLSYEKGEMQRYPFGFLRIRLELLKLIQNRSLQKSNGAIFLTQYAADVIQKSAGKILNMKVINHGVSNNFRIGTNNGVWNNKNEINCVYVSNIDLYKHQWNVALAIEKLREKGYSVNIEFVGGGSGSPRKKFDEVINKMVHKKVIKQFEYLRHDEIPNHLQDKDIFIFASSCENMPNTLIEGMCTGLPIACSDRGPMPEVLKDGGVYFDPEDIVSIASSIELLITDENKRLNCANTAKKYSNEFSWGKCSNETFNFIIDTYNKSIKK